MRTALAVLEGSLKRDVAKQFERRGVVMDRRAVFVTPIKKDGTIVFWELLDIAHLQAELMAHDILLRGALTIGDVAMQPDAVAGPGVLQANRLCDEMALVPRVVVDPSILLQVESNPLLRAEHHTPMEELGYVKSVMRLDTDGLWFVDYLAVHCHEAENAPAYLEAHRRLIERRLDAAGTLDRESRAWTWLFCYHNRVVDELHAEGRLDDDTRRAAHIPAKSPLVYAFPPSAKVPPRDT
jgi:hypothetical protein